MKVTAKVTRSGDWWAIEVPEVPGVFTQAKRLDQVAAMVADAVSLMEGVDAESVEVAIEPQLRTEVRRDVEKALRLKRAAAVAADEASTQLRSAAAEVLAEGLSVRDAAVLLELSPQRISQLSPQRSAAR